MSHELAIKRCYHHQFVPYTLVLLALSVYRLQMVTERATRYQFLKRKARPGGHLACTIRLKKAGADTVIDEVLGIYGHGKKHRLLKSSYYTQS